MRDASLGLVPGLLDQQHFAPRPTFSPCFVDISHFIPNIFQYYTSPHPLSLSLSLCLSLSEPKRIVSPIGKGEVLTSESTCLRSGLDWAALALSGSGPARVQILTRFDRDHVYNATPESRPIV
jgi:hypothetical protein